MTVVKTITVPKTGNPKPTDDPYHAAAVKRGKAAVRKLQELGVIDSQGRRIRTALPEDMQEGLDRDFGGYQEQFVAAWPERPIEPIAGTLVHWP